MSRWNLHGDARQGYDDCEKADRWAGYPYSESYDYRQGWEERERDERREERQAEERREEEAAQERAEEQRRHEAYLEQQRQEEAQYQQMMDEQVQKDATHPNPAQG